MHNTQQAIKWAGMHKTVTVKGILCDDCFIKKNNKKLKIVFTISTETKNTLF